MMTAEATPVVGLPDWYAWCGTFDGRAGRSPASAEGAPLQVGGGSATCGRATFATPEGPGVVLFDGYLFERDELGRAVGCDPRAATDAGLVVGAFRRWGAGMFSHLDGCYAVAVWDPVSGSLTLGHDALGRHPVFYALSPKGLAFSPNVLALAASGWIPKRPNRLSLALGGFLYWPEAGETYFEGIQRLPPGHYLVARGGRVVAMPRYWEPMPGDDEPWLDDEEVQGRFEPELQAAVARRMAIGAEGIFLSGGVDSVTVAALAAIECRRLGRTPIVAVSGRSGAALTNEESMQARVSEALGMPLDVSTTADWLEGRDDVAASLDIMSELPSPTRIWWVATYMGFYRRTARSGRHVLLTGAGGDNWLGVADAYAADLIRSLQLGRLRRFVKSDIATGGASVPNAFRRLLWAGGLRPLVNSSWARLAPGHKAAYHRRKWRARLPVWWCPDPGLRSDLVEHLIARRVPDLTPDGTVPASYYRHSLRSLSNPYLHHENETAYHIESACGLRLLSPYHDRRLVSFLNRIAPHVLLHGGRYKGLLRPVASRHLPGLALEDQRKDYPRDAQADKLARLRSSLARAWMPTELGSLDALGIIDEKRARASIGGFERMDFDRLARAFFMLSADRWVSGHLGTQAGRF